MSSMVLWLAARRLRQLVAVSVVLCLANMVLGTILTPVPGQLFSELDGLPLAYLAPVVWAVSTAMVTLPGTFWFERSRSLLPIVGVYLGGLAIAFSIPLLVATDLSTALITLRNAVLLTTLTITIRNVTSAAATSAVVICGNLFIWTFGWNDASDPNAWALTLRPADEPAPLVAIAVLVAAALCTAVVRGLSSADSAQRHASS